MPDWLVRPDPAGVSVGTLQVNGRDMPVLLGRNGMKPAADKREGDGSTPTGTWRVLYGLYRADRVRKPDGGLPWLAIQPDMGWCDTPEDPLYNQLVPADYAGCVDERLWRADAAYDYVLVLDHNQNPVRPGAGSAVFVHVWRKGAICTAGCVALKMDDMQRLSDSLEAGQLIRIG